MKKRIIRLLTLLLALALLAGCGSIAPKEKTLILSERTAEPDSEAEGSSQGFEVKKITRLSLDKLDPSGIHPDMDEAVIGWMDEDNLVAMSVQTVTIEADPDEQSEVEQPTERILTQFVRINYQYGFYDPILTLTEVAAECFDVSADGQLVALVAGNTMDVYSFANGQLQRSCTRQVLASRVTFAQSGHDLYFTAAGDVKLLEKLDVDTGSAEGVLGGKSYRALAASDKALLLYTQTGGAEQLSYLAGDLVLEDVLTGGSTASCCILSTGEALVVYDRTLFLIGPDGAQAVDSGVTAFDIASDGMHIAYARRNEDGTVDIRVGYWGGSRIINDKLVYKYLGIDVSAMYFSPDMRKLYLQGADEHGVRAALTFEFQ